MHARQEALKRSVDDTRWVQPEFSEVCQPTPFLQQQLLITACLNAKLTIACIPGLCKSAVATQEESCMGRGGIQSWRSSIQSETAVWNLGEKHLHA